MILELPDQRDINLHQHIHLHIIISIMIGTDQDNQIEMITGITEITEITEIAGITEIIETIEIEIAEVDIITLNLEEVVDIINATTAIILTEATMDHHNTINEMVDPEVTVTITMSPEGHRSQ